MNVVSFDNQVAAMRQGWPRFKVVRKDSMQYVWEGPLKPNLLKYIVRVRMKKCTCPALATTVQVIDPLLTRREEEPQVSIPHIYPGGQAKKGKTTKTIRLDKPLLCLYSDNDLQCSDKIANTIVPWTINWLVVYEFWLATGIWKGGGVDH